MKKVLIITYYWPPSGGGGVQRWVKFVKYFKQFGIKPVVYTPSNPERPSLDKSLQREIPTDVEVIYNKIWEPYSFYKKFTRKEKDENIQTGFLKEKQSKNKFLENIAIWIRGNFFIPDARKFWIKPSIQFLTKYIQNNNIDAIITTGPPHSMHMIGLGLKEKTGIPWLADFRDPWTNIYYFKDFHLSNFANKKHHQLENKVLKAADSVCVVSPSMKRDFESMVNRKYSLIPNGYDEEDLLIEESYNKTDNFVLAHIGSLTKARNHQNLWTALKELAKEDTEFERDLRIRNVGKIDVSALDAAESAALTPSLEIVKYLPHNEVIREQLSASMLLLLIHNAPNAKLILTGKIFEYLASGRPIICIGPIDGDAAHVIRETNCGQAFDFNEVNELKKYIRESYLAWKQGRLKNNCKNIEQFSRKQLTAQMSEAIKEITRNKQ